MFPEKKSRNIEEKLFEKIMAENLLDLLKASSKLNIIRVLEYYQNIHKETHKQTHYSKNTENQRQGENLESKRKMTHYLQRTFNKVNNSHLVRNNGDQRWYWDNMSTQNLTHKCLKQASLIVKK